MDIFRSTLYMSLTNVSPEMLFLSFVYVKMTSMKIMNTSIEKFVPYALIVSIKPQNYFG